MAIYFFHRSSQVFLSFGHSQFNDQFKEDSNCELPTGKFSGSPNHAFGLKNWLITFLLKIFLPKSDREIESLKKFQIKIQTLKMIEINFEIYLP